jgi:hypothetical protein
MGRDRLMREDSLARKYTVMKEAAFSSETYERI